MLTLSECDALIFESYARKAHKRQGYDQFTRNLSGMSELFARAEIPLNLAPTVTVTGSKGKGTTAMLTAAFLQSTRHKVGLVTSPHYLSLRERIRFNGQAIAERDWQRIITRLAPIIRAVDAGLPDDQYLSPTGIFIAIAMRYFEERRVHAIVLEVGRGGRFDDVSLIHNRVSVFTPIDNEHLDKMGPTVADVAWHKAGIIKPNSTVITPRQQPDVMRVIESTAQQKNATLQYAGEDILYTQTTTRHGQLITLRHPDTTGFTIRLHNSGVFLGDNAALAYGAARVIYPRARMDEIVLERLRFAGRAEQVSQQPIVFVDGAVHEASARLFVESVREHSPTPRVLIVALPHDKDHEGVLNQVLPHVDSVIVTEVSAKHLIFNDRILHDAQRKHPDVTHEADVFRAFQMGMARVERRGTLWVVGTQSLVRDALSFWEQDLNSIFR